MPERPIDRSADGTPHDTLQVRLREAAAEATSRLRRPRVRPMLQTFIKLLRGMDVSMDHEH
jgi:hypothetical protein